MMKVLLLLSLLAVSLASDVIELGDSNFKSRVDSEDIMLVEFFAPWCGHCKRLAPEYEIAATALLKNDPPVPLAKVDCTEAGKDTCSKYGVSGYPTLKIFRNGEVSEDYNGGRDSDGIISVMKKKAGPASKNLLDVQLTEKFLDTEEHSVIGFFTDESSDLAKQFQKTADSTEDFKFGHTFSTEVMDKYGYKDDIILFRPAHMASKMDESILKYTDDATVFKIKAWLKANKHGLCGHRTPSNAEDFTNPLVVVYYDVDYKLNAKGTNYWRNRVMKVAKKLKGEGKEVNFAISKGGDFSRDLSDAGMSESSDSPQAMGRGKKNEKFVMSDKFSVDTFEQFVRDMLDGKLEPYLKSEPLPDNPEKGLKVVVAKNFEDIVNNPEKDVLIEFYAPWCGHCKSLEPKYNELAEKLKDEEGVTIAKMDATANDVPAPYEVSGFPTLFFAKKGSKDSPKKYEGGREVDDFVKYIARESTDPLTSFDRSGKSLKKKKKSEL